MAQCDGAGAIEPLHTEGEGPPTLQTASRKSLQGSCCVKPLALHPHGTSRAVKLRQDS
jgi:hypothetical protein